MNIPMRDVDPAAGPWDFQMCRDEQTQLTAKVAGLLVPAGVSLKALEVDVANLAVLTSVAVIVDEEEGDPRPVSVPQWKMFPHLTPWPANYIADSILMLLGIEAAP